MKHDMIEYKTNTASEGDILEHLQKADEYFVPALSSRIDLRAYAEKLHHHAVLSEAWENDELIGLIGTYFNDKHGKTGFISNVSVLKPYMGKGISKELLHQCLEHGRQQGFKEVQLEVGISNSQAIRFYEKSGFRQLNKNEHNFILSINLTNKNYIR